MDVQENIILAKRNIVDSIWKQANLEGIAVTFPDTYTVVEGGAVSGLDTAQIVTINNLKHAWQFLLHNLQAPTDVQLGRQLNGIIGANLFEMAGQIRDFNVYMGGTTWVPSIPDYDTVRDALVSLQSNPDAKDRALDIFCYLSRSQVFADGNKRTATLIANKELISHGAGVMAVPVDSISEFSSRLVRFYETNNPDDLKDFLSSTAIIDDASISRRLERQSEVKSSIELFSRDSRAQRDLDRLNRSSGANSLSSGEDDLSATRSETSGRLDFDLHNSSRPERKLSGRGR